MKKNFLAALIGVAVAVTGIILFASHNLVRADRGESESKGHQSTEISNQNSNGDDEQSLGENEDNNSSQEETDTENSFGNVFSHLSNLGFNANIPQSFSISPEGRVKITGAALNSVASGTMQVAIWGLNLTIDISHANINAGGQSVQLSDMKNGDKIMVSGTITQGTNVIAAEQVQDRSLNNQRVIDIQNQINQLLQLLRSLQNQFNVDADNTATSSSGTNR